MPILSIQRRMVELGRIRLGVQKDIGNGRMRPDKLDRFRFTSPHERHIRDLAKLYGGEVQPWDNAGKPEWEVISGSKSVPVIVLPTATSQWMELWSGGGCQRRCDGQVESIEDRPCVCATEPESTPKDRQCKPTTRVGLMLPDLEAVGLWRLETHGWNAAAELPGSLDLAAMVGSLVPARLLLAERTSIRDGKTSRFVVPVLDVQVTPARLREIAAASSGQVLAVEAAPARPALAMTPDEIRAELQAPPGYPVSDALEVIAQAADLDVVRKLWTDLKAQGVWSPEIAQALTDRAADLKRAAALAGQAPSTPLDDLAEADAAYTRLSAAAGLVPLTQTQLSEAIHALHGKTAAECSAAELLAVLDSLPGASAA